MKLLLERKMNRVYFYLHRIGSLPSLSAERNLILWGVSYSSQGSFQGSFFGGQWGPVIVGNVSDLECVCKCSVFFFNLKFLYKWCYTGCLRVIYRNQYFLGAMPTVPVNTKMSQFMCFFYACME